MGPYATLQLADMGADVIKIEPPQGDIVRQIEPARHAGMGGMFLTLNRSKRSVVIDLKHLTGRQTILRLAATSDALLYTVRPQGMVRLGLAYEDVAAVNPRIIYAGAFGYGQDGALCGPPGLRRPDPGRHGPADAHRSGRRRHAALSAGDDCRPLRQGSTLGRCSAAKYLAGEAGFNACQQAVMTHGGFGNARGVHVERYLREVMIPRIAPVSLQLVLCFIAEKVLGLPKSY